MTSDALSCLLVCSALQEAMFSNRRLLYAFDRSMVGVDVENRKLNILQTAFHAGQPAVAT
jgi:hypothetical protein